MGNFGILFLISHIQHQESLPSFMYRLSEFTHTQHRRCMCIWVQCPVGLVWLGARD